MADGIYSYATSQGTRYYFKYRKSDGVSATKRGFASPRAARRAREQLEVASRRGQVSSAKETLNGPGKTAPLRIATPVAGPAAASDRQSSG